MTPNASDPLQIALLVAMPAAWVEALAASDCGPFQVHCLMEPAAWAKQAWPDGCDALIATVADLAAAAELLGAAGRGTAVIVIDAGAEPAVALDWWRCGAQEVMRADELALPSFAPRLRGAIERQRREQSARTVYATDVETGLPHRQQLVEHMSHLLALREREPAPMALLVLRIEGLASAAARHGAEPVNVLRRKIGVRLRAGVRASDVVASIGNDRFAVLLGSLLTPLDAAVVGAKLLAALAEPFRVATDTPTVAAALGIALYPQDGTQPDALLRRATTAADAATARSRDGFANFDPQNLSNVDTLGSIHI